MAGPGERGALDVPDGHAGRITWLGLVPEADKPAVYAAGDVYCAPNTHGESFGIVLIEAMAAGTPVVASDLEAFRRVLEDGAAGVLVPVGDPAALADGLAGLLRDPARRGELAARGRSAVWTYDWSRVSRAVVEVYETVAAAAPVSLDAAALEHEPDAPAYEGEDDPGRLGGLLRRWLAGVTGRVAP